MIQIDDMEGFWCDNHRRECIEKRGHILAASVLLAHTVMWDKGFMEACDHKAKNFSAKLKDFSPLCCYLRRDILDKVLEIERPDSYLTEASDLAARGGGH